MVRLRDYATFFSTERSIGEGRGRLLADDELDTDEREARDGLYQQLIALRAEATDVPWPWRCSSCVSTGGTARVDHPHRLRNAGSG